MRDFFASAAPDDLFQSLDSKGWDVTEACAVFDDGKSGEVGWAAAGKPALDQRTCMPGDSGKRPSTQGGPFKLWFDGVTEELKGRRRKAFAAAGSRQSFHQNHGQVPSSRFGT